MDYGLLKTKMLECLKFLCQYKVSEIYVCIFWPLLSYVSIAMMFFIFILMMIFPLTFDLTEASV